MLRWKPESHAAVNRSYTLFANEWRAKYSYLREPLVWELIEVWTTTCARSLPRSAPTSWRGAA